MRKALVLLLALLPALAFGADFGKLSIEKGYSGPLVVDVTWADGSARDITGATGTFVVYSGAGTVLLSKTLAPAGSPSNRLSVVLTKTELPAPGTYYGVVTVLEGATEDPVHGTVVISGR